MMRANAVDLITVSPEAGGVGTEPTETKRTVYCMSKASDSRKPIWQWVKG